MRAFRRSIESAGLSPKDVDFYLTTNRKLSGDAKDWFKQELSRGEFKALLHRGVKKKKNLAKLPYTKLYPIFKNLKYDYRDLDTVHSQITEISDGHGMLPHEVEQGVDAVVGHLNKLASSSGDRIVNRSMLIEKLVGRKNPFGLTGDSSLEVQRQEVRDFKNHETQGMPTVARAVIADIANSAGLHPFVLVKGAGGCGKSVAVSGSASRNLVAPHIAPGFVLIVKAADLAKTSVQDAVSRWRNQTENPDGNEFQKSVGRLRLATQSLPTITIYVDGVDERHGQQGLPTEARVCLSKLIEQAVASIEDGVPAMSVVVTCRTDDDLNSILGGGGFALALEPFSLSVLEFDDDEMLSVVRELKGDPVVNDRLESHLSLHLGNPGDHPPSSLSPIAPDRLNTIRHPVLWRCFSQLTDDEKNAYLDGKSEATGLLAEKYVDWFYRKVESRVGPLALNSAKIAMSSAAKGFASDASRNGRLTDDWIKPCSEAGCLAIHQMPIFEEAISAGLIERRGHHWRWLRPWLCEWIANGEVGNA